MLIDPKERNKGMGRSIHNYLVNFIKNIDGSLIRLGILDDNLNTLKFWSMFGYEKQKETPKNRGDKTKNIIVLKFAL